MTADDLIQSAKLSGNAAWSVRQTRCAPNSVCPISGKEIDRGNPWSIFRLFDAIAPNAASDVSVELREVLDDLNARGITDMDEQQVGVTLPEFFTNATCIMEKGHLPISRRSVDGAIGLSRGERCHGVSLLALHRMSPTISKYLAQKFHTEIPAPPAPKPEPTPEEMAEIERQATQIVAIQAVARALEGREQVSPQGTSRALALLLGVQSFLGTLKK